MRMIGFCAIFHLLNIQRKLFVEAIHQNRNSFKNIATIEYLRFNELKFESYNVLMHNLQTRILLNPNWEEAKMHARAISVGKPSESQTHLLHPSQNVCNCCNNFVYKQDIPLCDNTKELECLGIGFPLYFVFFKYCIILLLVQSISTSLMSLQWATQENETFCLNNTKKYLPNRQEPISCTSPLVYLSRIQTSVSNNQGMLRLSSFLIHLFLLIYLRDNLTKLNEYYDERSTTFSDYTIIIDHLPKKTCIKKDIEQLLSDYKVMDIVLIGDFECFETLHQQKLKKIQKLKNLNHHKKANPTLEEETAFLRKLFEIEEQIQMVKSKISQLIEIQRQMYEKDQVLCEKALVCLDTDQEKEAVIEKFKKEINFNFPDTWIQLNCKVKIAEAPEPKQILWQNINISLSKRIRAEVLGWLATITLLSLVSFIFYLLLSRISLIIQTKSGDSRSKQADILAFSSFFFVIFFNKFVFTFIFHKISNYQRYTTLSRQQFGFTLKYLLGQFFTTALMTLLVEDFTHHNIYLREYGVIQTQSIMIALSSFFIPLIWLVNPWAIYAYLRQKYYFGKKNMTQAQANQVMEKVTYVVGKRYAEIIKLLWLVFLYQSLIPIGCPLAAIGLTCYYWVDKVNLYRRSSVKQNISGFLTLRMLILLDISLILKPVGEIIFDFQIRTNYSSISLICLIIAVIYLLLPVNSILSYFHSQKFNAESATYSESKEKLGESYKDQHPILGFKHENDSKDSDYDKQRILFGNYEKNYQGVEINELNQTIMGQIQSNLITNAAALKERLRIIKEVKACKLGSQIEEQLQIEMANF